MELRHYGPQLQPVSTKTFFFFRQQQRSHEYFNPRYTCMNIVIFAFKDPRLVELEDRYCNLQNGNLRCIGEIKFAAAYPVYWQASVAYSCAEERPPDLDVTYDITLTPYANITCRNTSQIQEYDHLQFQPMLDDLSGLYNTYSPWNFFGLSLATVRELSELYPLLTDYTCYQHLAELLLRLVFS